MLQTIKKCIVLLGAVALLASSCNQKEVYLKEVEVPSKKSFFKVIINHENEPLFCEVKATAQNKLFDFNVIDSLSHADFKISHDSKDLEIIHKILDTKTVDTTVQIPKGKYLFGFENFANNSPIQVSIKIATYR